MGNIPEKEEGHKVWPSHKRFCAQRNMRNRSGKKLMTMPSTPWGYLYDVVDGKVSGLVLNRLEQIWLSACWEVSGALKAIREQTREDRRRDRKPHKR